MNILVCIKQVPDTTEIKIDKKTGLKYATNEQVFKDVSHTKNLYTKTIWLQMLSRYNKLFVKNYTKFKKYIPKQITVDYSRYGV